MKKEECLGGIMDNFFEEPIIINDVNDLNRVYHHLIGPVQAIESLCEYKHRKQMEFNDARGTLSSKIVSTIAMAIQFTATLAIPFLILFALVIIFKKTPEGIRYITVYENWFTEKFEPLDQFAMFLQAKIGMTLGSIIGVILTFLFFFIINPLLMLLFPAMLVVAIVVTIFNCIKARLAVKSLPEEIEKTEEYIKDEIDRIAMGLALVPPDYRSSDAIQFFCKVFDNKKADSLKEAMIQYDDYVHKMQVEYAQQEILDKHNEALRMLAYQSDRIDALNSDIRRLNSKVSWI